MMVKVLATADWQLDMRGHKFSKRTKDLMYNARLSSLDRLLKLGIEHKVDAILASGDLFEVPNPRKSLINEVARIIHDNNQVDIHVIPGNHDLCGPGSVWSQPEIKNIEHLHVHSSYEPVDLGKFILHPLPVLHKHELVPYDSLLPDVSNEDRIHIVMAHAHDISYLNFSSNEHEVEAKLPIDSSKIKQKGYDLCILGHWHSWTEVQENALYPGTHEQTKFGERDAGNVALIEVEKGRLPKFEKLKSGELIWRTEVFDVGNETEESLIKKLYSIQREGCNFLHLSLVGEVDLFFQTDTVPRFIAAADPMFGHLEVDISGLQRTIDIEDLQQKHTLSPLLSSVQNDILNELALTNDKNQAEKLHAELREFWRCLRDSGIIGEVY